MIRSGNYRVWHPFPVSQTALIKCSRHKDEVIWVNVCVLSLILSAEEGWLHHIQNVTTV